jgi:predicted 3-demethylubiquinone-9 3-methyltransferase (glyoxalase superfamily)
MSTQKITPSLWFTDKCEEAVNYYVSVFPNSKIELIKYYPDNAEDERLQGMNGKVLTAVFELNGERFMALDGGPLFEFTGAISFEVECGTQEEIDHYWEKLSAVPEAEQCGWCKDKYGVSWQIIPTVFGTYMQDEDPEKVRRVTEAFMKMKKFDIAVLTAVYEGK